jgi:Flp pilus assembly pilin Flp
MSLLARLWRDDCGALIATEWVFVATILVLGIITGLVAVRQAVINELDEFANAVLSLNQSFSFSGQSNCQSSTAGSAFVDSADFINTAGTLATATGSDISSPCD